MDEELKQTIMLATFIQAFFIFFIGFQLTVPNLLFKTAIGTENESMFSPNLLTFYCFILLGIITVAKSYYYLYNDE